MSIIFQRDGRWLKVVKNFRGGGINELYRCAHFISQFHSFTHLIHPHLLTISFQHTHTHPTHFIKTHTHTHTQSPFTQTRKKKGNWPNEQMKNLFLSLFCSHLFFFFYLFRNHDLFASIEKIGVERGETNTWVRKLSLIIIIIFLIILSFNFNLIQISFFFFF